MASSSASGAKRSGLAVIGLGDRASHIARLVCEADPDVRLCAIADSQSASVIRDRARSRRIPVSDDLEVFNSVDALLKRADEYAGLIVGTPCHLHAPIAVKAAVSGVPIFLEKPVAISWEQVDALGSAFAGRKGSVVVSFPLRLTTHVQTALQIVRSGRLGAVNQLQAVNNVSYGGVYFGQWYREYGMTGGLWLQKATHDFDYITHLLGSRPTRIVAMHGRLAYGGAMSRDLICSRCDQIETCPESPKQLLARGDDGGSLNHRRPTPDADHDCNFSDNILNQDCGSAIVMFENGVHASYVQNFLPRRGAGERGATIIGYDATLHFSWYSNKLRVIEHHRDKVEEIELTAAGGHGGGDEQLAANFVDVMRGRSESRSPLTDGLLSAAMCLAARDAAATGVAQLVPSFDQHGRRVYAEGGGPRQATRGNPSIEPPVDLAR